MTERNYGYDNWHSLNSSWGNYMYVSPGDPKEVKEDVKQCEMPDDMKQHAIDTAKPLVAKKKPHKEVASTLKKEFDEKYEPSWVCIAGTDYGSSITHAKDAFIYMYLNKTAIMLFKV